MGFAGEVLGILTMDSHAFEEEVKEIGLRGLQQGEQLVEEAAVKREDIEAKIVERSEARKSKDFARADEIRDWLAERGVLLKDGPEGTTWEIKK